MKHLVLFCALMLAVGALLVSCQGEPDPPQPTAEPSQTLPPAEPGAFDLTDCVITRPQAARGWLLEASREISSALSASASARAMAASRRCFLAFSSLPKGPRSAGGRVLILAYSALRSLSSALRFSNFDIYLLYHR